MGKTWMYPDDYYKILMKVSYISVINLRTTTKNLFLKKLFYLTEYHGQSENERSNN